jgi:hypothetical protein
VNWRCRMEDSDESAISAMATTEEGGETAATAVMVTTEEDDEHAPTEEVWTSEEGGSSVAKQPARQGVDAVMEVADAEAMMLNDHLVPRTADVARVRMARKAAQREAKNHRILQATRRAAVKVEGVESVERVVKELDAEVVRRRRAQTAEAQEELMQRRARRPQVNLTETRRPDQRARVSLVKRAKGVAVVNAARGSSVEADDGLPTAIMDVNGEKHAVKWDSAPATRWPALSGWNEVNAFEDPRPSTTWKEWVASCSTYLGCGPLRCAMCSAKWCGGRRVSWRGVRRSSSWGWIS